MQPPKHTPASKRVQLCQWLWRIMSYVWGTIIIGILIGTVANYFIASVGQGESLHSGFAHLVVGRLFLSYPIPIVTTIALLLVVTWLSKLGSHEPASPSSTFHQISAQDRRRLLKRLRLRYEQMFAQSLQGVVHIELGLTSRPRAIANAASLAYRFPAQLDQPHSLQTTIIEVYDQAQQELLILGDPGAGKSTLLLELAQHLLRKAEQDKHHPIPVLLPLSTWAINRPSLQGWLSEQFAHLYDIPKILSQQWIESEVVLPLLDGLDEMNEAVQPACIAAINAYHHEHLQPLVVCSRTSEYEHATTSEQLTLHTAVVVQPLSPAQTDAHLARLGEPLKTLRTALKKNATLATLATTPLMLQILMLTYQGTAVRQLSQKKVELEQQIWTDYVRRMVERKGDVRRYPLDRTNFWLQWLARSMRERNQTIFALEDLQPNTLPANNAILYSLSISLLVGLLTGPAVGLVLWLVFGLSTGLVGGLSFGLLFGLFFGLQGKIQTTERIHVSWKRLSLGLLFGLALIVVFDLVCWLFFGLVFIPVFGLVLGLFFGLLFGLFFGLQREPLEERQALTPNEGIRRSLLNGVVVLLVVGVLSGLIAELQGKLFFALLFGLQGGLIAGLLFGLATVVQHYLLRIFLWHAHLFPYKAIAFLEDATTRILLQRVDSGYSFIHPLLLNYFAGLDPLSKTEKNGK